MKVETSTVTKIVISDVPRLDPITVFLEDYGLRDCGHEKDPNYKTGAGKITINCWDKSWNAFWGGMGPRTVAQFIRACDAHYILNCLSRGLSSTRFTGDALHKFATRCIVERRRGKNLQQWEQGSLDKEDARSLWRRIDDLRHIETTNESWHQSELLTELFGDEWHYPIGDSAVEENHDYSYLLRIIEAVQKAFAQPMAAAA